MTRDNVVAPFVTTSVVIVTVPQCRRQTSPIWDAAIVIIRCANQVHFDRCRANVITAVDAAVTGLVFDSVSRWLMFMHTYLAYLSQNRFALPIFDLTPLHFRTRVYPSMRGKGAKGRRERGIGSTPNKISEIQRFNCVCMLNNTAPAH